MASFAILDDNDIVINTIKISNDEILDENGNESESLGIQKVKEICGEDVNCVQFWYSNENSKQNPRFRPANIGAFYDRNLDIFLQSSGEDPLIFDNQNYEWTIPPEPSGENLEEGFCYSFNFETKSWELIERPKPPLDPENPVSIDGREVLDYAWNFTTKFWDPIF